MTGTGRERRYAPGPARRATVENSSKAILDQADMVEHGGVRARGVASEDGPHHRLVLRVGAGQAPDGAETGRDGMGRGGGAARR